MPKTRQIRTHIQGKFITNQIKYSSQKRKLKKHSDALMKQIRMSNVQEFLQNLQYAKETKSLYVASNQFQRVSKLQSENKSSMHKQNRLEERASYKTQPHNRQPSHQSLGHKLKDIENICEKNKKAPFSLIKDHDKTISKAWSCLMRNNKFSSQNYNKIKHIKKRMTHKDLTNQPFIFKELTAEQIECNQKFLNEILQSDPAKLCAFVQSYRKQKDEFSKKYFDMQNMQSALSNSSSLENIYKNLLQTKKFKFLKDQKLKKDLISSIYLNEYRKKNGKFASKLRKLKQSCNFL